MSGKSVYIRSVIYMITVVSVVVLLGCGVYYFSIRNHIMNEMKNNNAIMDKQIASTYELFLDSTINAAMVSIGDDDIQRESGQVYEQLNHLMQLSDFIHSAYYRSGDRVYVSMGFSFELNEFYDKEWMASLDMSKDLLVLPARKLPTLPNGYREVIPIVMNFPLHALDHAYSYVLNVDAGQLFRYLIQNQNVYEDFRFRIIDPSGMIFVSSDTDELFKQIQDYDYISPERILGNDADDYIAKRNGNKLLVSTYTSPLYGWKYVSESDYDPLSRSMLLPLQIISVIVALSLIVSFIAVTALSRRLYRPVKEIVKMLGVSEALGGDSDEYALISGRIHRFLTENQQLKEAVDSNRPAMRRQFLYDLLVRNVYGEQEIREKLEYFGFEQRTNFTIAVFRVDDTEAYTAKFTLRDRMLLEFAMENIAMEIVREKGTGFFLGLETARFAVAVSIAQDEPGLPQAEVLAAGVIHSIQDAIELYLKLTVSAGIGLAKERPVQLYQSFREGSAALAYAESIGPLEIVTYRELHVTELGTEYPYQIEEKLLQHLTIGDREGAVSRLREMFDAMREQRASRPGEHNWLSFQLLHALARKQMELNIPESEPLFDDLSFSGLCQLVLQAKSDWQRMNLMLQWIEWFCGYIAHRRENASNEHVRQMLDYIREYYAKPISVDGIAEHIGLNRVYVGRLFKQYVNQNMGDYINQVRIDKAVELMTETNMKVMDIAEAVGFNNTHYFIKIFKKLKGITPGKFMEQQYHE